MATDAGASTFAIVDAPDLPCDALAELFLGETARPDSLASGPAPDTLDGVGEQAPEQATAHRRESEEGAIGTESAASGQPHIEAVLAGHLPVLASAWISQHARSLAARTGAIVGVVRLREGEVSIDAFGEQAPEPAAPAPSAEAAIRRMGQWARRWLLIADEPTLDRLLDAIGIERLTLLSGADDAAMVAGYRLLKELLQPRLELAGAATAPRIHIAIAGAAGPEAMSAAERLSRAAERFLSAETTVEVTATRIDTGRSVNWFRGPAPQVGALLSAIRAAPAEAELEPAPEPEAADADSAPMAIIGPGLDPHPHAPHESDNAQEPHAPPAAEAPAKVNGKPAAAGNETSPLPALRCPAAPAVAFRVERGRLVAIADARAVGVDVALRDLVIASAWAAEQATLIAQATGLPAGLAARVLLVRDVRPVRKLLDADIQLRLAPEGRDEIPLN